MSKHTDVVIAEMKICVKSRDGQDGKRAVPRAGGQLMGSDRGGGGGANT